MGTWAYELYKSTINFVAPPNAKIVTLRTRISFEKKMTRLENVGVYAVGNYEYESGPLACVELGLATAIVPYMTICKKTAETVQAIQALNDRKNTLADTTIEKHNQN